MSNIVEVQFLHVLDGDLARIAKRFKPGACLTLVVRHPSIPDGGADVVVTNDNYDLAIAAINRLRKPEIKA